MAFMILPAAGTESLITINTSGSAQAIPAISGDWIVWADTRNGNSDIYAYNLLSGNELRLTPSNADANNPAISGNLVVWQDHRSGNYDIYLYDLGSGPEQQITSDTADQVNPTVDGNLITWQDNRDTTWDIYSYNIITHAESLLTPDTTDTDQIYPAVSGNLVVWQDYRFFNDMWGSNFYDIFMNDTVSGALYNLSPGTDDTDQLRPAISGSRVVWQDDPAIGLSDIHMNDTSTGDQSIVNDNIPGSWKILPAISGNRVVWLDNRDRGGGFFDIYLKDLTSGSDTKITPDAAQVVTGRGARISGSRVVWADSRNGDDDIFLNTTDSTLECPVADFTILPSQSGAVPFSVQFTDTSSSGAGIIPVSHWNWEFGDGNTSVQQSPLFTYTVPGNYDVRLTINNPSCRNETPVLLRYLVSVGAAPVASFTEDKTSGMVPLTVTFTDTSVAATAWNWSFGDGTYSELRNPPPHPYTTGGTYAVDLNASNTYGYNHAQTTIHALTGTSENADTSIDGITISSLYGGQFLTFDTIKLPGPVNTGTTLICRAPQLSAHGWQNITFLSRDGTGFVPDGTLIKGNLSGVVFLTRELNPGLSDPVGPLDSIHYSLALPAYPAGALLNTQIWEGYTPADLSAFGTIAQRSGFSEIWGIAYTTKITKTNFPEGGTAKFQMNVNSSWVEHFNGRDRVYVMRISDDRSAGEVLPSRFLFNDPVKNLDYFEIDSPHGLSTFGLSSLSGSGNPLQLITLTVTSHVNPPSSPPVDTDSGIQGGAGAGAGKVAVITTTPTPTPTLTSALPDPGKSAKVYTNAQGVVTQETRLQSSDGRATVTIPESVVAKDAGGKPLTEITLKALPSGTLPEIPTGSVFTFAGMAYELGPDGATFSPPVSLSFTIPQAQWGQDYIMKTFDEKSGTWQDLPASFDAATGTITAPVSHLCIFALFAEPRAAPVTLGTPLSTPAPAVPQVKVQPPTTAVSIFTSMVGWVADLVVNNIIPFVAFIFLGVAGYMVMMGRFPGSGQ
jgi:beta propeller repeat protein